MLTPPTSAGAPGPHIPGTGVATTRPAGAPFQHAPAAIPSSTSPPPAPVVPVPAAPPVETAVRGLIALNFKFLDYIMDQGLLYDLQRDPDEMHNVLSDLHYTAVRKILADRLKLWRKETRDPRPPQ